MSVLGTIPGSAREVSVKPSRRSAATDATPASLLPVVPSTTGAPPRTNRAIIAFGLLLCVALAVGGAYLLGLLDLIGLLNISGLW